MIEEDGGLPQPDDLGGDLVDRVGAWAGGDALMPRLSVGAARYAEREVSAGTELANRYAYRLRLWTVIGDRVVVLDDLHPSVRHRTLSEVALELMTFQLPPAVTVTVTAEELASEAVRMVDDGLAEGPQLAALRRAIEEQDSSPLNSETVLRLLIRATLSQNRLEQVEDWERMIPEAPSVDPDESW